MTSLSFHLFGDLWLEEPSIYLSTVDLIHLQQLMPLIKDLDSRRADSGSPSELFHLIGTNVTSGAMPSSWDLNHAFDVFAKKEVNT